MATTTNLTIGLGFERWLKAVEDFRSPELEELQSRWEAAFNLVPDPRVTSWPLVDITQCLTLAFGYLVVTYGGMMIMAKVKRPFEVYTLRVIHNFSMVVLSMYMLYMLVKGHLEEKQAVIADPAKTDDPSWPAPAPYTLWCLACYRGDAGLQVATGIWWFYISKPIEFLDTFIMVLRKSDRQINFLHVYHHFTIFLVWYVNLRYNPGGEAWFAAAANALVHVVMYSYYFLATLGIPCPWKQYVTQFQIFQFVSFVAQGLYALVLRCPSAYSLLVFNCVYAFSLLALFVHFYRTNYRTRRPAIPSTATKKTN